MITTGPGLIRPIATASTNCCSVSQWWSCTSPWCKNGTMARPEPNVNALALAKKRPIVPTPAPPPVQANPLDGSYQPGWGDACDRRGPSARQAAAVVENPRTRQRREQPYDLGRGDCGHRAYAGGN